MSALSPQQEEMAQLLASVIGEAMRQLRSELEDLNKAMHAVVICETQTLAERLARIERSGYAGTWHSRTEPFLRGTLVTFDGQLWAATEDTNAKPGQGAWKRLRVER